MKNLVKSPWPFSLERERRAREKGERGSADIKQMTIQIFFPEPVGGVFQKKKRAATGISRYYPFKIGEKSQKESSFLLPSIFFILLRTEKRNNIKRSGTKNYFLPISFLDIPAGRHNAEKKRFGREKRLITRKQGKRGGNVPV